MLLTVALALSAVRISNGLVTAPNGIAFVVDDSAAFAIDLGGDYVAGIAAPDDSYHDQTLKLGDRSVRFEWGRLGDAALIRLSSPTAGPVTLKLLSRTWPGFETQYDGSPTGALGFAVAAGRDVNWSLDCSPKPARSDASEVVLDLGTEPTRCVAGFGRLPRISRVDAALDAARARYLAHRPSASGDWGDFLAAISDNLNNSRIYASDTRAAPISVSRGWAGGHPNTAPYFCWDSFFNGALACLDDPATARATVRAILGAQTPDGLVPNFAHWNFGGDPASNDRSQPPVGSLCVWKMEQRWPDLAFLKEVYPKLLKWHRWWPAHRDGDRDGLLEWGSSAAGRQGALWETGWDDTPQFDGAEMVGDTLDADAVDLNSLWAMDAEYLALIADAVGARADAAALRKERLRTLALIDARLWNADLGVYCSRMWSSKGGAFLTRLTPMNFYPLIAGAPDASRARRILTLLTDTRKFWGRWVLPTVPFDDPLWAGQTYWHGTIWAPVNFLVAQGLRRYYSPELQAEFGRKCVALFMRNWTEFGQCGENFGSDNGLVRGDPHYTWGALMCLVGLESVCFIEDDGSVTLNGAQTATLDLENVPIHGRKYELRTGPGWAELRSGRRLLARAEGKTARIRLP